MTDTLLGRDLISGAEVRLGDQERRQGLYVIGGTGTGKSTLLLNLILQHIETGQGLCLLDPHGDLIDAVLRCVPAARRDQVALIDALDSEYPFGLNLFECRDPLDPEESARTLTSVMHVFEKLWGPGSATPSWGPQMADLLRNVILVFIENPGMTMVEVPLFLEESAFRAQLMNQVTNRPVRRFWEGTYNALRTNEQLNYRMSTLNKVREFLTQPLVRNIVGQSKSTVDFRYAMDNKRIQLVNLPTGRLGDEVTSLLGMMIAGKILAGALSRQDTAEDRRQPFYLYADEYQRFASADFAVLLAEARKFAVGTTIAHQFRAQLDVANRGATLNVANKIVFAVSGGDAEELAREFDSTPPQPDVIGQKPIVTYHPDPFEHLMNRGHRNPDPTLQHFINFHQKMHKDANTAIPAANSEEYGWVSGTPRPEPWGAKPEHLRAATRAISQFLYTHMTDGKRDARLDLLTIAMQLKPYLQLNSAQGFRDQELLGLYLGHSGALLPIRADWKVRYPDSNELIEELLSTGFAPASAGREEHRSSGEPWVGECGLLRMYFIELFHVAKILHEEPVMVETGQYEPIYDRPRTYADVQNEIATTLANLDPYIAWCKLLQDRKVEEFTIRTYPAPNCDDGDAEGNKGYIRELSRALYAKPRTEVEQEMLQRQEFGEPPSTTSRRVEL